MKVTPIDIALARVNDNVVVNLFCIDEANQTICLQDQTYQNYFYVTVIEYNEILEKQLREITHEHHEIISVEQKNSFFFGDVHAYKITVSNIHATKPIAQELKAKKLAGVKEILHVDIPFVRKYVMDHEIVFLKKAQVKATKIESDYTIPTYQIDSLKQTDEPIAQNKLNILGFDIETYVSSNRINTQKDPIIMIGLHDGKTKHVFTWGKYTSSESFVTTLTDEKEMIEHAIAFITELKPHIIVGYNSDAFDFAYVKDRCDALNIKPKFGLDNSELRFSSGNQSYAFINGIPHVDLYNFIRTNMRQQLKTQSLSLSNVSQELLGDDKIDVDIMGLFSAWDNTDTEKLDIYAKYNAHDSKLCVDLFLKLFPNILEFSNMIHISLQDLTRMSYSQLVENYLMTNATKQQVLIPNRPTSEEVNIRLTTPKNVGAFVYKPTPGFYENVAVFDFRSLYPSIIASLNIDKAVMTHDSTNQVPEHEGQLSFDLEGKSFIPGVVADIVARRDELKKQAKLITDSHDLALARARIYNLKILANSLYGYLSFARARWYNYEGGGATTAYARHFIKKTIAECEKSGFKVIYGDTDSVFLSLGNKKIEDALKFLKKFNKTLPGIVELQFEDNFETGIFVGTKSGEGGAKKRYALYDEDSDKFKIAGLEYVRGDWSDLARELQYAVLEKVLKEKKPKDAIQLVRETISNLSNTDKEKFIITNKLSRELDQYESNLPHVVLARRLKAAGKTIHSRSRISYIVCKGGGAVYERVQSPEQTQMEDIDTDYYINNQIIPAVISILSLFKFTKDDILGNTTQGSLGDFF